MRSTGISIKPYYIALFFIMMFATLFLSLNLTPLLTRSGDSNAETADVNLEIDAVLALALSKENINLDIVPTGAGAFVYDTTIADVSTNNKTGYTLTMNTKTDETALIQEGTDYKVTSLTDSATVTASDQSSFTINSWGYANSDGLSSDASTTFNKIPSLSTPDTIASSDEPAQTSSTPITFAARLNTSIISGTYTSTMTFSATTNFVPEPEVPTFSGITTMQEMTSDICAAETTPTKEATQSTTTHSDDTNLVPEATLTDTRDGETYTVRKLADGNCWMSQNLRLKLTANTPLTSADTDVSSNFTPTLSTQAPSENTTSWGRYDNASDVNTSRSYDTGNRDYGTYYNWFTATAGTGLYNNTTTNATSSICPKGWQLPLNDGAKSYENLITTAYSLASNAEGSTKLQSAPLSFPLSGFYFSGLVYFQGSNGFFWSATPRSTVTYANSLGVISSGIGIGVQSTNYKACGFSVRCVSR